MSEKEGSATMIDLGISLILVKNHVVFPWRFIRFPLYGGLRRSLHRVERNFCGFSFLRFFQRSAKVGSGKEKLPQTFFPQKFIFTLE